MVRAIHVSGRGEIPSGALPLEVRELVTVDDDAVRCFCSRVGAATGILGCASMCADRTGS